MRTASLLLVTGLCILAWPTLATTSEATWWLPTWYDDLKSEVHTIKSEVDGRCDPNPKSTLRVFAYPSCVVSAILDPDLEKSWRVTLILLAPFLAILVRQALQGYVEGKPILPLVLFVAVLIGTIWRYGGDDTGSRLRVVASYALHVSFSALAAGVLAFWTRYVLRLLSAVAVAGIVVAGAGTVAAIVLGGAWLSSEALAWFSVATGVAGGAWLFWRSVKEKRAGDGSAQAVSGQSGPLRVTGASSDGGGPASRPSEPDDG